MATKAEREYAESLQRTIRALHEDMAKLRAEVSFWRAEYVLACEQRDTAERAVRIRFLEKTLADQTAQGEKPKRSVAERKREAAQVKAKLLGVPQRGCILDNTQPCPKGGCNDCVADPFEGGEHRA